MDREHIYRFNAVKNTHPSVVALNGGTVARDNDNNIVPLDESKIAPEMARLKAEYENDYSRKRREEYPKIEELVVALYDTQDRAEIDQRRSDVKKKYPKE